MQKTYKSKRELGGCLNPKDILNNLDEKCSVFDAFYIQNIKQTKRDLSCISSSKSYSKAANKVRKRKRVKRLVKEAVTPQETLLMSTYLTPDKSIHVKKEMDLFDQLLNSSSTQSITQTGCGMFDKLRPNRNTYTNKFRKSQIRKLNCSSSDSQESEKENSKPNFFGDATDVGQHKLIIEKETMAGPCIEDDSINQIVNNKSLLKDVINNSNQLKPQKYSFTDNKNFNIGNSPLCSTPFTEKYRGKSIYNFSPIIFKLDKLENEQDQSVICVDHSDHSVKIENLKSSPILAKSPKVKIEKLIGDLEKSHKIGKENYEEASVGLLREQGECDPFVEFSIDDNLGGVDDRKSILLPSSHRSINTKKKKSKDKSNSESKPEDSQDLFPSNGSTSKDITSTIRLSANQEPFKGFSKLDDPNQNTDFRALKEIIINDNYDNVKDASVEEMTMLENEYVNVPIDLKTDITKSDVSQHCSDGDNKVYEENDESLYNTCSSEDNSLHNSVNFNPKVVLQRLSDSTFKRYYEDYNRNSNMCVLNKSELDRPKNMTDISVLSERSSSPETICKYGQSDALDIEKGFDPDKSKTNINNGDNVPDNNYSNISVTSIKSNTVDTSMETDEERDSSYDTCSTNRSDSDELSEENNVINNKPVVLLEKLNQTTFDRYYNKHIDSSSENIVDNFPKDTNSNLNDKHSVLTSSPPVVQSYVPDKVMNFVTTRRKNDTTDDTLLMMFNETCTLNPDFNKTVLSVHNVSDENIIENIDSDNLVNKPSISPRISINNRKSVKTRRQKMPEETFDNSLIAPKATSSSHATPMIILQPGKKWERSLSIYKRMTMLNDLDCSTLDDEDMGTKGRKYRESVIHTMEMQEHKGPLHNESIQNYRCSILPSSRCSTIRIVRESNASRLSLQTSGVYDELSGFLREDCDDTVVELSRLSIADTEHEVTVLENIHESSDRLTSAEDYVLRRCDQTEPILFDECYPDTVLKNCHKIGEGVYGEVFLWRARDGLARVMKVVPVAGDTRVNGECQKDFAEIISEIVIAMELSALRAPIADIERQLDEGKDGETLDLHSIGNATDVFNKVLAVRCVYGKYPSRLLELWELFDECRGSDNDNPASLPDNQRYVVLELANAGQDLESHVFANAEQAYALLLQVAYGLAVAEEAYQFEHRDLHWGNVLIAPTDEKYATFVLRGRLHRVARRGVAATIIDYSLSRLSLPLASDSERADLYNDLAHDETLFAAYSDYQFDVYRLMRERLGNDWKNYEPYTNILWLHYIVDKMITALRYKRTNTKIHKHYIAKLKGIKNRLLTYRSAVQFVLTDNEF